MGSVADRIARKIISASKSRVVDLASWREGRKIAIEAFLGRDGRISRTSSDRDPCYAQYALGQNFASILSEFISGMREAKDFARIVGDAEDEYWPSGPPMSPLTKSYFTMWAMFDVRFGSSSETIGTCILRSAPGIGCPSWLADTVERMQQSRMGFFVHCGRDDGGVLLREVGTREIISCAVPAGYNGLKGQIWFVRVLPPPNRLCRQHIVFNTPYVIRRYPESAFVDYLGRELVRMAENSDPNWRDDAYGQLMKYGPNPNHWNEYIVCAYSDHKHEVIFLTGIPDIRESLPHA